MPIGSSTTNIDMNGNTVTTTVYVDNEGNTTSVNTSIVSPTGEYLGGNTVDYINNTLKNFTPIPGTAGAGVDVDTSTLSPDPSQASATNNYPTISDDSSSLLQGGGIELQSHLNSEGTQPGADVNKSGQPQDSSINNGTSKGKRILFSSSGTDSNGKLIFYYNATQYIVYLQAVPENITESREATFSPINIAKRMEPVLVYQYSGFRKVSFNMTFGVFSPQDATDLYTFMSLVRRSVMPTQRGIPMYIRVNLGAWMNNLLPTPSGFDMDDYTDDDLTAMVASYSISPSEKRLFDPDTFGKINYEQYQGVVWEEEKVPAKVTINLDLQVFQQVVWSGVSIIGPEGNVETDPVATTLPALKDTTSKASGSIPSGTTSDTVNPPTQTATPGTTSNITSSAGTANSFGSQDNRGS